MENGWISVKNQEKNEFKNINPTKIMTQTVFHDLIPAPFLPTNKTTSLNYENDDSKEDPYQAINLELELLRSSYTYISTLQEQIRKHESSECEKEPSDDLNFADCIEERYNVIPPNFKDKDDYCAIGLSVDGGGMRGIIPALFLERIENITNKKIYELVDHIAGVSIGGILGLGCVASLDGQTPILTTEQLVDLFWQHGGKIFNRGYIHQRVYRSISKLITYQYSAQPLELLLGQYFGDTLLSQSLKPILVTAIKNSNYEPVTFESNKAKESPETDYFIRDIGRATSAAPTYFDAATIDGCYYVDGGLWINNPSQLLHNRLRKTIKNTILIDEDIIVVSFGTGTCPVNHSIANETGLLTAAAGVIEGMMSSSSQGICQEMSGLIEDRFLRYQPTLDKVFELDDCHQDTLKELESAAQSLYPAIDDLARHLAENYSRKHPSSIL